MQELKLFNYLVARVPMNSMSPEQLSFMVSQIRDALLAGDKLEGQVVALKNQIEDLKEELDERDLTVSDLNAELTELKKKPVRRRAPRKKADE